MRSGRERRVRHDVAAKALSQAEAEQARRGVDVASFAARNLVSVIAKVVPPHLVAAAAHAAVREELARREGGAKP